jgi:capsular polysaccharide biosynthesis protein
MELRLYAHILLRRWPLVLIPALVVLLLGLVTYNPPAPAYNVGVRFLVGQDLPAMDTDWGEERYYNWLASEYIVNSVADWVKGTEFAAAISAQLALEGVDVPPGSIQAGLVPDNERSTFTLSFSHGDAETAAAVMEAAILVLQRDNASAIPPIANEPAMVAPIDDPIVTPLPPSLRSRLDLPLRIVLAVGVGIGLAFLVEYLDPTVRHRKEVEAMGLTILGEIPGR